MSRAARELEDLLEQEFEILTKRPPSDNKAVGRPLSLNDEVIEKIVAAVKAGAYVETAYRFAGVTKRSFFYWMQQAKEGKQPFLSLRDQLQEAFAFSEIRDLHAINQASAKSWQAAAWKLERKFPHKWGRVREISADIDISPQEYVKALDIFIKAANASMGDPSEIDENGDEPIRGKTGHKPGSRIKPAAYDDHEKAEFSIWDGSDDDGPNTEGEG